MTRRNLRPLSILIGLLALGTFVGLWLQSTRPPATTENSPKQMTAVQQPTKLETVSATPAEQVTPPSAEPPAAPQPVAGGVRTDGKRELQAYRLVVRGGVVSLDGNERIAGDFHRRRGPQAWMPGMWCVRLLDANMRVLAEETANAPDDACVVLDPQNLDANGKPQVTQFAGAGEDAMLQVRMPPNPAAKWLKVYRLSGMERADWNTEPMGRLLTSIPLP